MLGTNENISQIKANGYMIRNDAKMLIPILAIGKIINFKLLSTKAKTNRAIGITIKSILRRSSSVASCISRYITR